MAASLLLAGLALGGLLELDWEAPEACPSADDVQRDVLEAITDPDAEGRETLKASAAIRRGDDDRFTLELTLAGSGTRTLTGSSCGELADAAVLILAIAIDPKAIEKLSEPHVEPKREQEQEQEQEREREQEQEQEREQEQEQEQEREQEQDPEPDPEPDPQPARAPHIDLHTTIGAAFGILPGPGAHVALGLGVRGRLWRAELEGTYTSPSEEVSASNPDVRGRFQIWSIAARAGPAIPAGSVRVPITVGIEAGGMHGAGVGGFAERRSSQAPWVGFIAGAAAIWRPPRLKDRLGFGLRAEGIASLTRPSFGTAQSGRIYRARSGGARIGVLLAVTLL